MRGLKPILVICYIISCVHANAPDQTIKKAFDAFIIRHNKIYSPIDYLRRFTQFIKVYKFVFEHNKKYTAGEVTFDVSINYFADWFTDEISNFASGAQQEPYDFNSITVRPKVDQTFALGDIPAGPSSIDWNAQGHVTPVKDQGYYCASCWAFGAAAALESQLSINGYGLRNASEQNLIDCNLNSQTGNFGCKGGNIAAAYMYIKYQPGIAEGSSYPYQEDKQHSGIYPCRYNVSTSIGSTLGYGKLPPNNETLMKDFIGTYGPVAFSMNAKCDTFIFYSSGIYNDPNCMSGYDHAALIYGYGTVRLRNGTLVDYWLCKNSWSTQWGNQGYFKIIRGRNMAGLAANPIYPQVPSSPS